MFISTYAYTSSSPGCRWYHDQPHTYLGNRKAPHPRRPPRHLLYARTHYSRIGSIRLLHLTGGVYVQRCTPHRVSLHILGATRTAAHVCISPNTRATTMTTTSLAHSSMFTTDAHAGPSATAPLLDLERDVKQQAVDHNHAAQHSQICASRSLHCVHLHLAAYQSTGNSPQCPRLRWPPPQSVHMAWGTPGAAQSRDSPTRMCHKTRSSSSLCWRPCCRKNSYRQQ